MKERISAINEILDRLNKEKENKENSDIQYAIKENIAFFEATKTILQYIRWMFKRAPRIESEKLLEINDLLPEYDKAMHLKLIEMERRPKPGLIKPAVDLIYNFIQNSDKNPILVSLGSGGMELERQIIERSSDHNLSKKVTILAVDQSSNAQEVARNNLRELNDKYEIYVFDTCTEADLLRIHDSQKCNLAIVLCKNDIFRLEDKFSHKLFDLAYHTHFKHHLTTRQKEELDLVVNKMAKTVVEYDGFLNWVGMIPQTIIGWNNPVFLNAEIFSNLRYFRKTQLQEFVKKYHPNSYISFSKLGFYVLKYNT